MLFRVFVFLSMILNVACASVESHSTQDKKIDFEIFNRTAKWATGAGKYDEPTPFSFYVQVRLSRTQVYGELSHCGQSLKTSATDSLDHKKLREPFHEIGLQELIKRNAQIDDESHMLFAMIWMVADVPASLSRGAPTSFCLVQSKVEVGEKFLSAENRQKMERYGGLPPSNDDPFFVSEKLYFVTPEYLRKMIEDEISLYMQQIVPTLNGEIDDQCGYFDIDPDNECAMLYRYELRQLKKKLSCAEKENEAAELQTKIDDIEEKLAVLPPEPARTGLIGVEKPNSENGDCD